MGDLSPWRIYLCQRGWGLSPASAWACAHKADENAAHAGNAARESFYGKMETLFVGRRKK